MSDLPNAITVTGTAQRQAWLSRVLPPVEQVRPGRWSIPTVVPSDPLRYALSYAVHYDGGVALVNTGWPHLEQTGRIVNKGEDVDSWQLASVKD